MKTPLRIVLLLPYPSGRAPSQRFRIEHFIPLLKAQGHEVTLAPFLDARTWSILYLPGNYLRKGLGFARGFIQRYALLFKMHRYDRVWIHRETAPLGLPIYAWLLLRVWRKKVIFEFDDAIWMPNVSQSNRVFSFLKPHKNSLFLMRNSWKNAAGNAFLQHFAQQLNANTYYLPTVVDTQIGHRHEQVQDVLLPSVGWTGSHSTLHYLESIVDQLRAAHTVQPFKLIVISDTAPVFDFPDLQFIRWSADREEEDLLQMHIGLMPLPNEPWAEGKCGLKLIQYMALGIVPIASNVGVNGQIVEDHVNGLLCKQTDDWQANITRLLSDHELRKKMASTCRQKIIDRYSVGSQERNFLHLLD
jgi:glycosyltransferase involved in cell wall biosynthesis